jgi:uncharacterized protein YndB with AHSA1/START domain
MDLRPGGRWRVTLRAGRRSWYALGEYVEIEPPERLVFTWGWEHLPLVRLTDSLVTVEFAERGLQTELVLTHERLRHRALRAWHVWGWRTCLDKLGPFVAETAARRLEPNLP